MKKTCYNLTAFNLNDALSGGLCMALNSAFTPTGPICDYIPASPNPESTPYIPRDYMKKNEYVLGVGVCKYESPYLLINIENDTYVFDENGNGVTERAKYYKLWMATVVNLDGDELDEKYEGTPDAGLDVDIYTHSFNEGGYLNIINEQTTKRVSNLTTRDKFATSILQGILGKISDPAALSISEIQFYCEAAYKWADSMLLSAASRRSECLQYWKNDTMHDVSGNPVIMYVDSWRNLMDSEGHGYNSEEEAVEDGWVFYPAVDDNIPTLESTIKKKLDEVTEAISNIESGGGGGGGTDVSGIVTQLTAIKNKLEDFYTYRGTYSYPLYIQNKRGDSSNNPIYISGGGSTDVSGIVSALNTLNSKNLFGRGGSSSNPIYVTAPNPVKSSFDSLMYSSVDSFLTFNSNGDSRYTSKTELESGIENKMRPIISDYADTAQETAVNYTGITNLAEGLKAPLGELGYKVDITGTALTGYDFTITKLLRLFDRDIDFGSSDFNSNLGAGNGGTEYALKTPLFKIYLPANNTVVIDIYTQTWSGREYPLVYNWETSSISLDYSLDLDTQHGGTQFANTANAILDSVGYSTVTDKRINRVTSYPTEDVVYRVDF